MRAFAKLNGGNFTKIPNELLNDSVLSWKAKGLFCHMASKPDNFNFTVHSLSKQFPSGKSAISGMLKELKDRGWVSYYKNTDGTGKYYLNTTLKGRTKPKPEKPNMGFPKQGKTDSINKKDSFNKKDIYKGEPEKAKDLLLDGDIEPSADSSSKYSREEILDLLQKGVIRVN